MIKDKSKYLEFINDDDQILVMRKILDKLDKVLQSHSIEYTDFLDPYQCRLSYSFLNKFHDISYYEEGGYEEAERKSIIIYPEYLDFNSIEIPVTALRIDGGFKFSDIKHRDLLGSIMGLGIKREKIGDILIHNNFGHVIIHKEIADYILFNLEKIGKEPVKITEINLREVTKGIEDFKEIITTVASLRLDAVLSSAYNISRTESSTFISSNKVKVNWQPVDSISLELKEGDIISLRGFGRAILDNILGESKKGRLRIKIRILK